MTDEQTTIAALRQIAQQFRDERNWGQYHDPKNIAEALSIEAGELLEHMLWKDVAAVREKLQQDSEYRSEVGDELADVFIYALHFANVAGFDLATIVEKKMAQNAAKYPIDKAHGTATKYTKL